MPAGLQDMEAARVQTEKSNLLRAMDCFTEGVMLLNVTTNDFRIMFLNDAWARITGAELMLATQSCRCRHALQHSETCQAPSNVMQAANAC